MAKNDQSIAKLAIFSFDKQLIEIFKCLVDFFF